MGHTKISKRNIKRAPPLVSQETERTLATFAIYSTIAYYDAAQIQNWNCRHCSLIQGTRVIAVIQANITNAQAYVAINTLRKEIVVAFRGTSMRSLINLLIDKTLILDDYPLVPGAQVHAGFLHAFHSTQGYLMEFLDPLIKENPTFNVYVTGHSLGGALAVLKGLDIKEKMSSFIPGKNLFVYTFGQPRVGNKIFADYIDKQISLIRTTHTNDLIPHVPFHFLGYEHAGKEMWIMSNDNSTSPPVRECDGRENDKCANSIPDILCKIDPAHGGPYFGVSVALTSMRRASCSKEWFECFEGRYVDKVENRIVRGFVIGHRPSLEKIDAIAGDDTVAPTSATVLDGF
ncbi:hypothetical protein G9A89_019636 [Geosiphon pyriformis]|nr:hypothetical protein G9A89_019636 [Geosiphon pyriformis]